MPFDGYKPGAPLRVALFSGNYNYTLDGANKALNRLVDHLESVEGFKVRVYSPTSPTPAFEPKGELVSVPSVTIPLRSDYRFALGLPEHIRRNVEAFRPDIVHLSSPDLLGHGAQRLARRLGVPVVASLHTLFETYLDYYALGWLRPALERRLRAYYGACDVVLAPTRPIADRMVQEGVGTEVRLWGRGVDGELFSPARRDLDWRRANGLGDGDVAIAFFGRLVMEKGLAVFADAAERVMAARSNARVVVIGDGPARAWMEERLPRAVFTGFLTGEPLARAVASADLLLNPSKTETFGNVTLEALASGLPVVGADALYHRALLTPGETGLICPAEDASAYAGAIESLIDDPAKRAAMGRAARVSSGAYQWRQILSGVADVYRELVAARQTSRAA